jgi:hypothetical protein
MFEFGFRDVGADLIAIDILKQIRLLLLED